MRIAIVITSLGGGGAETVVAILANAWAARGDHVTIITFESTPDVAGPLHPDVVRCRLGIDVPPSRGPASAIGNNALRLRRIREAIRRCRPDVVVSMMDQVNVLTIMASVGLGIPVVVSERCDPTMMPLSKPFKALRVVTYPLAAAVVVQTEAVRRFFASRVANSSLVIIPNPVRPELEDVSRSEGGAGVILSLGRLAPQKGHDLLIAAFARIASRFPEWKLMICGEGGMRGELEARVRSHGLGARVELPGRTEDLAQTLGKADIFVLSSRFEGFPNALLDAMSAGLAVISFDCPSGPADIIDHDQNGLLVPALDVAALATAMQRAIEDRGLRERIGIRAREVRSRYSAEAVIVEWDRLFERVRGKASSASREST